jgi:hypothetical protein
MTILAENSLNLSDSDSNALKNEIEIINEKLVSAVDNEKILLDERKSLIEDFM